MFKALIATLALASCGASAPAFAQDIRQSSEVETCRSVGIFSAARLALTSVSGTIDRAMEKANEKAKNAGADTVVLMTVTADRNLYTAIVQGYNCSAQ